MFKKRLISVVLILGLLLCGMPGNVIASEPQENGMETAVVSVGDQSAEKADVTAAEQSAEQTAAAAADPSAEEAAAEAAEQSTEEDSMEEAPEAEAVLPADGQTESEELQPVIPNAAYGSTADAQADFDSWYNRAKAVNADHIIGPGGDISTNTVTLILPGETVGIIPDAGFNPNGAQGGITVVGYNVIQLQDVKALDTYLPRGSATGNAFTPVLYATAHVAIPYEGSQTEGITSFEYTSVYENTSGYPVVIRKADLSGGTVITNGAGRGYSGFTTLSQSRVSIYNAKQFYYLENTYQINYNTVDGVFFRPGAPALPTEIFVDGETHTYTFPNPLRKGYVLDRWWYGDIHYDSTPAYWNRVNTTETTSVTFSFRDLLNHAGLNNAPKDVTVQVNDYTFSWCLTAELHAEGGTFSNVSGPGALMDAGTYFLPLGLRYAVTNDINGYKPVREGYTFKGCCTDADDPAGTLITGKTVSETSEDYFTRMPWANNNAVRVDSGYHIDLYAVWDGGNAVSGVSLDRTKAEVRKGGSITLKATVSPADAPDKTVTWKSSNTKVATVSASGKVNAVGVGTAVITVTTKAGNKTASCTVTVLSPVKQLWRFYSSRNKDHFYTMYDDEKNSLIASGSHYQYEGAGWLIETEKTDSNITVYRFYNEKDKDHFYTISVAERNQLIEKYNNGRSSYRYENVGWYTPKKSNTPLYRFYSSAAKDHFYTTNVKERDSLIARYKAGATSYQYEGIAWYCPD